MRCLLHDDDHWTDEQLISSLYDVGPENDHLDTCPICKLRISALVARRESLEAVGSAEGNVSFEFLARQRREIYQKVEGHRAQPLSWRRWAPLAASVLTLVSGAAMYEMHQVRQTPVTQVSDSQLAWEISRMSQDWQTEPTAPLQGLFE